MKYLPVYNINTANGGYQQSPPPLTSYTPVFSSYAGNMISYGNIPYGMLCDALPIHSNYGKNYHVIVYNPVNKEYMAHGNNTPCYRNN